MSTCRYDREAKAYLIDGEPCRTDDYGDPTKHCQSRNCANHVGADELTCARCIGRTRGSLRRIPPLAALALPVAITAGVDSEAANLAGPATDPTQWSDRRVAMRGHLATWERLGRISERQHLHARALMEDDDELHPYSVLTRWAMMLAEDYGHDLPERLDVSNAAAYLERNLNRIAQDDEQDYPLFAREIRKCRRHLESVMATALVKERGAPCPACAEGGMEKPPRLVKEYAHWCDDEDCERIHTADDTEDRWTCVRNGLHVWTEHDYRLRVADWYDETTGASA